MQYQLVGLQSGKVYAQAKHKSEIFVQMQQQYPSCVKGQSNRDSIYPESMVFQLVAE